MPLQSYNQYFRKPGKIVVPSSTNAFATGAAIGQRQQGLNQRDRRLDQDQQGLDMARETLGLNQRKQDAAAVTQWQEQAKEMETAFFRAVDPDAENFAEQVEIAAKTLGQGLFGLVGEDAEKDIQAINLIVDPIRRGDPKGIEHAREIFRVGRRAVGIKDEPWKPMTKEEQKEKAGWGKEAPKTPEQLEAEAYAKSKGSARAKLDYPMPQSGERITVGPDGTVIERGGAVGPRGIQDKPLARKVSEKVINTSESIRRLDAIDQEIAGRPELMDGWNRLGSKIKSIGERLGRKPSAEDMQMMTDIRSFKRKAIENINSYIKEITGAQMSEKEADRIRLAQPDPGEGVWPAESYTEFMTALNDARKQGKLAIARYQYLLKNGVGEDSIKNMMTTGEIEKTLSLTEMRSLMSKRQKEILKLSPDIPKAELIKQLKDEFYGQ